MGGRGRRAYGADGEPLEKTVVDWCCRLYRLHGCEVYRIGQAPRATKQTAGIADLLVLHPASGHGWWHEVKRNAKEKPSEAQMDFLRAATRSHRCNAERCEAGRIFYVGDLETAKEALEEHGLWRGETGRGSETERPRD